MSENNLVDEQASGDVTPQKLDDKLSEPEPPKVPDVELIVDGFGFMPRVTPDTRVKDSKVASEESLKKPPTPEQSPCVSSSNIDIVRRYTWKTKNRMTVKIISYGATITSIQVPDRKGVTTDVVAGFDTLDEYFQARNPYFGSTIGRYANYIRDATVQIKPSGKVYALSTNRGKDHYNGGFIGFDKVNWRSYVNGNKVIMSHVSERFHEGYPGCLMVQITFEVTCDNSIKIEMKCNTTEPTIVNLSHSPYFNLAGHNSGPDTMYNHIFTINADKYTEQDEDGYVTGEKKVVGGSSFDFRVPRVLKTMINRIAMGGYDLNYCVTQGTEQDLTFHARVVDPDSGRVMEMYSNQPGVQFYTGNLLPDPEKIVEMPHKPPGTEQESEEREAESLRSYEGEEKSDDGSEGKRVYGYIPLVGKGGANYRRHGLFSLMPQNYPDAINRKNFPNSILNPGEVYAHKIQYKFGLLLGKYV